MTSLYFQDLKFLLSANILKYTYLPIDRTLLIRRFDWDMTSHKNKFISEVFQI